MSRRSPPTRIKQAQGLHARLADAGTPLPVYIGMRNWHPFLADTLTQMSRAGVRRAIAFIAAAHGSYSSCQQYKENVREARRVVSASGAADVEMTYAHGWHAHELFIEANARHVQQALARLPADAATRARVIFTAHSIPERWRRGRRIANSCAKRPRKLRLGAGRDRLGAGVSEPQWPPAGSLARPRYLRLPADRAKRRGRGRGGPPIGFVCDHIEVLYDLDTEAAAIARELGIAFARAESVNDDPIFLDMMADVVLSVVRRYATGRPLSLV